MGNDAHNKKFNITLSTRLKIKTITLKKSRQISITCPVQLEERQNDAMINDFSKYSEQSYHTFTVATYTSILLRIIRMLLYILIAGPSLIFSIRTMSV